MQSLLLGGVFSVVKEDRRVPSSSRTSEVRRTGAPSQHMSTSFFSVCPRVRQYQASTASSRPSAQDICEIIPSHRPFLCLFFPFILFLPLLHLPSNKDKPSGRSDRQSAP
jgi:hypothetical protein